MEAHRPPPRTDRRRLALFAVPMAAFAITSTVGNAIAPTLLVESPLALAVLSPRTRWMLLASPKLDALTFYGIPLLRAALFLLLWYLFGRHYGKRAVRWLHDRLPGRGQRILAGVERVFRRWWILLVPVAPGNATALLAGAHRIPVVAVVTLGLVGVGTRLVLVRTLADVIRGPLLDVLDWVGRNQLWLTAVSIAVVAVTMLWARRAGTPGVAGIEGVEELAEDLDVAAEQLAEER
jgi:hypothetical protein